MPDDTITLNPASMERNSFQNSFKYRVFESSEFLEHVPAAKLMVQKESNQCTGKGAGNENTYMDSLM